jgi:hypothetical protein
VVLRLDASESVSARDREEGDDEVPSPYHAADEGRNAS